MTIDWAAPAAWDRRSDEFGALSTFDDGRLIVAMEYSPKLGRWDALREAWMELSPHPHLLDPLEAYGDDGLLLRYAAIHWGHPPLYGLGTKMARATMAAWIQQLADVFRHVLAEVELRDVRHFACPLVKIDLGDAVRVGFWPVPAGHVAAPELDRRKPKWDERSIVFVVGQTLQTMVDYRLVADTDLGRVIGTCVEDKPRHRYQTLAALQEACNAVVPHVVGRDDEEAAAWRHAEEGMGWLAVGERLRAFRAFKRAESRHYDSMVQWGVAQTVSAFRSDQDELKPRETEWVMKARPLRPDEPTDEPYDRDKLVSRATASAQTGDARYAFDLAQRVLVKNPDDVDALAAVTDVLLRVRECAEAIIHADRLVALGGDVGRHHFRRGKALFGLGRLSEARDVFDRALSLDPKLVEAMLLRREVERTMRHTRDEVGTQHAPVIELPESLAPLRDVIATGNPRAIIEALSAPEHADNPDAQILLARYLALDGEPDRAQTIYDRVTLAPPPHRQRALVGKAGLMLAAGALVSALALFDVVCAEAPSDLDASEGRAQTLERLGRLGEAAAEYRRFVGLANARADLRVRAAQQWLDKHVF